METSSKYPASLYLSLLPLSVPASYSSNFSPKFSSMYFSRRSTETTSKYTMERTYATNYRGNTPSVEGPKKETLWRSIVSIVSNVFFERFPRWSSSFMPNINNFLSVTLVPNDGTISYEFFRSSSESIIQLESNKLNSCIRQSKDSLNSSNRTIDLMDFTAKNSSTNHHLIEGKFTNRRNSTTFRRLCADFVADNVPSEMYKQKSSNGNTPVSSDNITIMNATRSLSKTCALTTSLSFYRDKDESTMDHEIPMKSSRYTKLRRKLNSVAWRRGRGRGGIRLKRSGASQSRHRKRENLAADVRDDLKDLEFHYSMNGLSSMSDKRIQTKPISHCNKSVSQCVYCPASFIFSDLKSKKSKTNQAVELEFATFSTHFRCTEPEPLVGIDTVNQRETEVGYDFDKSQSRPRLTSESSMDSEDSCFIVFEVEQDSDYLEYTDITCDESSDEDEDSYVNVDKVCRQKVRFNLKPKVHTMVQWDYAYRAARRGPWEEMARDRERFKSRINCIGRVLEPILQSHHRKHAWEERYGTNEK